MPFHNIEEADIQLDYFEKLTTEPETYYLAKKPCTLCFGKWPCIMKKGAPKCRVCDGEACSFYDPKAVQTEPESSKSKTTSQKTNHKKPKASKPSSQKATSSKRQLSEVSELSELSYVDPSPVKPQKKSRIESPPARKEVVDDDQDEESDEEKYEHNSRTCRRLLDKLESQKWYKRLEGKGHCLRDLVEMEKLHWRSINGPKGRRFEEVEQMGHS